MRAPMLPGVPALALLVLAGLGLWVWTRGGMANAGQAAGAGLVNAAGGVVVGAVSAVSDGVGIPTPGQTTTDAAVARWIIDNRGYFEASRWAGVPALVAALQMDAGTGRPPAAGSAAAVGLGVTAAAGPSGDVWAAPAASAGQATWEQLSAPGGAWMGW